MLNDIDDALLPQHIVTHDGRKFQVRRNDMLDGDKPQMMKMEEKDGINNKKITRKRWNLPSSKEIKINAKHGHGGHTVKGERYKQSKKDGGKKDVFNEHLSDKQIEKMVYQAYNNNKILKKQKDPLTGKERLFIQGFAKDGTKIEMWINRTTKTIESYWSKY